MTARKSSRPPPDLDPLDDIDKRILGVLREQGRMSFRELARRVSVSRANAYARVARLTERRIIRGFTVDVDSGKAGLAVAALIALTIEQHRWRDVMDEVSEMPEVEYCASISGDFDTVILARARTIEIIRDVVLERIHRIEGIKNSTTYFVLEETPRAVVLP